MGRAFAALVLGVTLTGCGIGPAPLAAAPSPARLAAASGPVAPGTRTVQFASFQLQEKTAMGLQPVSDQLKAGAVIVARGTIRYHLLPEDIRPNVSAYPAILRITNDQGVVVAEETTSGRAELHRIDGERSFLQAVRVPAGTRQLTFSTITLLKDRSGTFAPLAATAPAVSFRVAP